MGYYRTEPYENTPQGETRMRLRESVKALKFEKDDNGNIHWTNPTGLAPLPRLQLDDSTIALIRDTLKEVLVVFDE